MAVTHKQVVKAEIEAATQDICKILGITPDAYIELRYELAFEWFKHLGYFEQTARYYLVSLSFHNWWSQTVAWREKLSIHHINNAKNRLEFYRELIITIPVAPHKSLCNAMVNEGIEAIKRNSELLKIRI